MKYLTIFERIRKFYYRYFSSSIKYARYIGVNIGKDNFINTYNWGSEPYLISIGNNVQITENVSFHTHGGSHVARFLHPKFDVFGKIEIKDGAYIGACSHIMPGVVIGKGVLVAAGSMVTKSIPDGEVWGGVPAKKISLVSEYIEKNLQYNVNTKGLGNKEKRNVLLATPEYKFIKK